MRDEPRNEVGPGRIVGRRSWLAGALLAGLNAAVRAEGPVATDVDEEKERRAVEDLGKEAGLRPFRMSRGGIYLGIGDAADDFRSLTLRDCEAIAADYLDHYRAKGFDVARPARRLSVVTLADDRSFAGYLKNRKYLLVPAKRPGPAIHGIYDSGTNRLVVYDHRSLGPQLAPRAGYENLRTLAHEATHQLTYNTGLLERRGDLPASISEGLAMYGEVRKTSGRTAPGQLNLMRLQDLATTQRRRIPWIPVAELLTDDTLVRTGSFDYGNLLAYAESWLLVHYLMNEPPGLPGFRNYLEAVRGRAAPERRLEDATQHLGDLDRLNRDLRQYAVRLQKSI
jgi:hypothetical protein